MKHLKKTTHALLFGATLFLLCGCVDYSKYPHIGDETEVLQFYKVKAEEITFVDTITVLDKDGAESIREYNGYFFVNVKMNLVVNNSDDAKQLKLDTNDFKLKNHVGTTFNSSEKFSNIDAFEDYSWCDKTISKGESFSFVIDFKFSKSVDLNKCLFVLEVDFSNKLGNHSDIVLSENASELQQ